MTTKTHAQGPSAEELDEIRRAALLYAAGRTGEALAVLEAELHRWGDSYPVAWTMILEIHGAVRRRADLDAGSEPAQVHAREGYGARHVTLRGDLLDSGISKKVAGQIGNRAIVSLDFAGVGRITLDAAIALTRLGRQLRRMGRCMVVANLSELGAQLFREVQRYQKEGVAERLAA